MRLTKLRQTIARRLKDAQNTAAMLTTFNEVDMTEVMAMRARYKDAFEKKHGGKLGFMGFFVKACVQALKDVPAVNAEIDGADLVFKNYYHLGIAVGTDKGLVVPVVRDADRLSIAGIEKAIADYGRRARDGQLKIEEMQGGTFTITNGGIYGSLMSTPILNAPQSGILGMHKIQERAMVVDGKVEIRPMMYLALSYDHRVVDGKEAVTFLVRVKEGARRSGAARARPLKRRRPGGEKGETMSELVCLELSVLLWIAHVLAQAAYGGSALLRLSVQLARPDPLAQGRSLRPRDARAGQLRREFRALRRRGPRLDRYAAHRRVRGDDLDLRAHRLRPALSRRRYYARTAVWAISIVGLLMMLARCGG